MEVAIANFVHALENATKSTRVMLPGVATFRVLRYPAFVGRNPRTNEEVSVPETYAVHVQWDLDLAYAIAGLPPPHATRLPDETSITLVRPPGAEELATAIRESVLAGRPADIPDVGVFDVELQPERTVTNPQTRLPLTIPERRVLRYTEADALIARLGPHRANATR